MSSFNEKGDFDDDESDMYVELYNNDICGRTTRPFIYFYPVISNKLAGRMFRWYIFVQDFNTFCHYFHRT